MRPIIYDVAVSIDGFIAGPGGDISAFAQDGPVVEDYQARLKTYSCAIMGRATYEFGYRFGSTPGANPYPHMDCFVFSQKLDVPQDSDVQIVRERAEETIADLKVQQGGPIYLCGGGQFAGSLLACGMIDVFCLKRAPAILGGGTSLFAGQKPTVEMHCTETELYEDGYLFQEFNLTVQ